MKSPRNKRILLSMYVMMRATWPYGFVEVLSVVLKKLVNRIVFMLLLLRSFRLFGRNVDAHMSFNEAFGYMEPVLWAILAAMVLPAVVEVVGTVSENRRNRRATDAVLKRYCYILFGSSAIRSDWTRIFNAQKSIMEHALFIICIAPLYLYYNPLVFLTFFCVTNIYVWVTYYKPKEVTGYISAFINNDAYVNMMKNLFFCIYLLICAYIIWKTPDHFPLEFLFLLIVGMRMQMGRAANLASALRSGALKAPERNAAA